MDFHPHEYQKIAIQRIIDHTHYGLLLDMGLGKTVSTLIAIEQLMYDQFDIKKVLLIAPKKVAESTWMQEANKWKETSCLEIASVLGPEKERIKALQSDSDIYVMNRENVQWLYEYYHKKPFPFDMLVIDESSSFKNPQAKRFKAMRKMRPFFKRVVILTGTPAPNTLMDVWAQMYLLDGGDRLGKTITEYRNRYFRPDKTNGHIVYSYRLLPGGDTAIFGKMQDICMSLKAKDYLTLPERIENVITVEMNPKEWALYKEMERDHVLSLVDDDDVSALNAASLAGKLLQLANGAIYTDEGEIIIVHNEKVERLKELVETNEGKPMLVFYSFKHDLQAIKEAFPKAVELKTDDDVAEWNKGNIQMLLAHPASAGYGLNLQAGGNIIVWYGLTWSLEQYQQANARLHRQGQTQPVIIHHLVTKGTMDEQVMKALERKEVGQDALLEAIKYRKELYKE
nr:MAG TPA: Helicase of the snf2 rad54 family [Caudoviricetes sp.]